MMNIGEAAKTSQVNAKMIRRYEEQGIIPKAGRTFAGYRQYSEKDVHVLKFVKRARELGFSMKDTKQLLSLWKNQNRSNTQVKSLAQKHKIELERKLSEIQAMLSTLDVLIKHCRGDARPECPILQELECDGAHFRV
jgi:MerR family gold-responsive transcriptional activator of gol and ges genes